MESLVGLLSVSSRDVKDRQACKCICTMINFRSPQDVFFPAKLLGQWLATLLWELLSVFEWFRNLRRIRSYATLFPVPANPYPVIGHFNLVMKHDLPGIVGKAKTIMQSYSSGVAWIGPIPIFFICEPKDIELLLSNSKVTEKPFLYRLVEPVLGKGLITSSGDIWRYHNKIIAPAFHSKILESFVPVYNRQAEAFIKMLEKEGNNVGLDIMPMAERLSFTIICEVALGLKMDIINVDPEFVEALSFLEHCVALRLMRPWLYLDWIFHLSPSGRRFRRAVDVISAVRDRAIAERRGELSKFGNDANEDPETYIRDKRRAAVFLDFLLMAANAGAKLSDKEIAEEVDTFMLAGHDTLSVLFSYVFYELARNPKIQEKACEELEEIFDPSQPSIDVSPEDLARLSYLEMVIKETMRLHPPVPLILRQMKEDLHLASRGDLVLPAGAQVAVGILGAHHHRDYYPRPMEFNPQHFSPDKTKNRDACAFYPFSYGQRGCIGKRLAMMEAKTVMAKVLWHFRVFLDPAFTPVDTWGVTLKPTNGVAVRLQGKRGRRSSYVQQEQVDCAAEGHKFGE